MLIRQIEKMLGLLLLVGVAVSGVTVLAGGIVFLWRHGGSPAHYRVFRGEPSDLKSLPGIWRDVWHGSGRGVIQLGLMLMVYVQVARVALTGLLFFLSRDRAFVVITCLVFLMLSYALIFAAD